MATLNDICSIITDGSHFSPQDEGVGYPMLSVKDMREDDFDYSSCKHVGEDAFRLLEANGCKPYLNDVVVAKDGSFLKSAFSIKEERNIALLSSIAILRPKTDVVFPDYLCHYLRSDSVYRLVSLNYITGTALKRIILQGLKKLPINLPSIEEQKKRALVLNKINQVIVQRKKQLQKLDDLVKARFVEMFGDMADPACRWPVCKLIDACDANDDIKCGPFGTQLSKDEYQDSGIPVWEIPQINSAFAIAPEHFLTLEKAKQLQAYTLSFGDIVMSRKGNVGKCALFPADKPDGILHSDVLRIRVSRKKADPCFMMCQLHFSQDVLRQIELVSSGAIMAGVNVTKLKDVVVKLPPIELQEQFAVFVSQIDKSKLSIQQSLEKLETLKQSLMQQYFG